MWEFKEVYGPSLLDYFAGQALDFCLHEFGGNSEDATQPAEAAYQIAEAMLAERERRMKAQEGEK